MWFHYDKDRSGFLEYVEFSQFMKDLFLKGNTCGITSEQVIPRTAVVLISIVATVAFVFYRRDIVDSRFIKATATQLDSK